MTRSPGIPASRACAIANSREPQLADRVRVAVEREHAAGVERPLSEPPVDVLPVPVAVELDRHPALGRASNTRRQSAATPGRLLNIRPRGWPRIATPGADRRQHARGLVLVRRSSACGDATTNSNACALVALTDRG